MPTQRCDEPVLALTVQPPWSHWVAAGIQLVVNRATMPPAGRRGRLVIHARQTIDQHAFSFGARLGHFVDDDDLNLGEFLAVAELVDVHAVGDACTDWASPDRYPWVLEDVRRIVTVDGHGHPTVSAAP